MEISPHKIEKKLVLFWFIKNYVGQKWLLVILASIFMAIEGSMLGFISFSVKELFDRVFVPQDKNSVWFVAIFIFAIFLVRALSGFLQRAFIVKAGIEIVSNIQKNISSHIIDLDYEFFFKNAPGDLIERIKGDGQIIHVNFVQISMALGRDTVSLVALLTVAFWIDWKWAMISLLGLPILILPIIFLQRYIHAISRKSRVSSARTTTLLDEAFHGVASIKLNGIEPYIKARLNKAIDLTKYSWFGSEIGIAGMPALIDLVAAFGFLGVMVFGGMEIINGQKSIGDFMSFFTAMALIFEPLRRLSNVSGQLQLLTSSLERLFSMNTVTAKINTEVGASKATLKSEEPYLEFKNVSLSFGDEKAVSNVSLNIKKGQFIAFVGSSGSGKSTMLNLISRLIEPTKGRIRFNGSYLTEVPIKQLRSEMSVVSQDSNLFDDTIFSNIALDQEQPDESKLKDILEKTQLSDLLENLDEGLNFHVGPRGLNISGGQRQRVALARALLRETALLLLDEPTSALDSETENQINSVLKKLAKEKTIIITTHNLDIAKDADTIFVFHRGELVSQGSHSDLLKASVHYRNLWTNQTEITNL